MRNRHLLYIVRLVGMIGAVTLIALALNRFGIRKENTVLLFLVDVLLVAYVTNGYIYGIAASVMCVMVFNYLFTEPVRSFSISDRNDVILVTVFLFTALISSRLTAKFQEQLKVARANEELAGKLAVEQEKMRSAMEKEQMRSTFLRGISHDLRTPLTVIAGASRMIAESGSELERENIESLARDIGNQAEWLTRLVENILNMTKIESGNMMIEKRPEAVEDVINNALTRVADRCAERAVCVHIPEDVLMVEMDGKTIVQVLINLLENAIRHTREDGHIDIRLERGRDRILFYVEDDGDGIDGSIKDTLFDEFVTARGHVQDAEQGIGLGLPICKAVITAHGGEITAENRAEGGARICFGLPFEEQKKYGEGY